MIEPILFIILLAVIYLFVITNKQGLVYVSVTNNADIFLVQNRPDKQQAATIIHTIKTNIMTLMELLEQDDHVPFTKSFITQAKDKLKTTVFRESIENSKYTSYSVNKGEEIVLCVRSKTDNSLHNIDLLMYVAIHELAHVICPEIGHTRLFNQIFQYILQVAEKNKLYHYIDYTNNNTEYCGIDIIQNILDK